MAVFFNGQRIVTPASQSMVNDSAMANRSVAIPNNLAIIGSSVGGKPNTALRFTNPTEALAVLKGGELLDAVRKAFDASPQTGAPATIIAVRVNPATQATLSLLDGSSNPVITLTSSDYGLPENEKKVKIEAGSTSGKKITVQLQNDYYTKDNVYRNAFKVRYSGAQASAVMTIDGTTCTLQAPSGTTVATIDLNTYSTVVKLVDRINVVTGFSASSQDGNDQAVVLNGLDYVTTQDVKTADYIATANLQACVDWFNGLGEGFVDAVRVTNAGTVPANIPFTYLSGASNGTVTNTEWQNAYTTLQTQDVQFVVPLSSSSAIHAMNDTHCAFMSGTGKRERRGIVGLASGSTNNDAITAAKALNSDRTSLVHVGYYDYPFNSESLTLYPPYMFAALLGGAHCGVNPGTSLTNKAVKVRGLERDVVNPTETDVLLEAGVYCIENTNAGYKVVQDITTWLINDNFNRVEVATGVGTDYTERSVREALDPLRGEKGSPLLLARAVSITEGVLSELAKPESQGGLGILVGDKDNPPFKNITARLSGDVLRVEYQASVGVPVNYVLSVVNLVPYTGTVSA